MKKHASHLELWTLVLILAAVPSLANWTTVKEWSGTGAKETEVFQMTSTEWRITWSSSGGGLLAITVYDDKGNPVSLAANTTEAARDTSYVHKAGQFYLKINGVNVRWSVAVEDNR